MRRILIIGVILVGAWFVFQEINKSGDDVNTEETATEEAVTEEETKTEESTETKTEEIKNVEETEEIKRNPIDRTGLEEDVTGPITVTPKEEEATVEIPAEVEEKIFTESTEAPVMYVTDTIKVFLYEWGIDLSSENVESGNIEFEVFNNGQFTHHFAIEGGVDFGKVVPGETAYFTAPLNVGEVTLYSPRQIDMDNEMQETLYVQ
jgi:hypothetical protein